MEGRIGGWGLFDIRKTGRASQKKMAFEWSILERGKREMELSRKADSRENRRWIGPDTGHVCPVQGTRNSKVVNVALDK